MAQTTYQQAAPAPPAPSRKRSDTSDDAEQGTGKKRARGRPRLETKDSTAVDRRRTQIRLAQRAYRNRKDSAIDTLKKKVKELEQVNEDMGREFMNFSDFVLGQGMLQMDPEVAKRLNDATRKFLTLSRKATEDGCEDDDAEADADAEAEGDGSDQLSQAPTRTSPKRTPSDSAPSTGDTGSTPPTEWSHEEVFPSGVQAQPVVPDPFQQFDQLSHNSINLTRPSLVDSSFPVADNQSSLSLFRDTTSQSPFSTLPMPNTYSMLEKSFGRRYQRASIEAGLSLALMENPPPERYMAVFSFCLQFESRQEIIRRLSIVLDKTRNESLNNWRFPFANLGGSGTWLQFPTEKDAAGNEMPVGNYGLPQPGRPPRGTPFPIGPFKESVETTRDDRVDYRMRMLYPGFEGDFFDADEVDGYLRQCGIIIAEGKDFVDAHIDIESFDRAPVLPHRDFSQGGEGFFAQASAMGGATPDFIGTYSTGVDTTGNGWSPATTTGMEPFSLMNGSMGITALDSTLGSLDPGFSNPNYQSFDHQFANMSEIPWRMWEAPPVPKRTKVTIDVNKLVAELVSKSVCLGRSPGVRPKDVNHAVKESIILKGN